MRHHPISTGARTVVAPRVALRERQAEEVGGSFFSPPITGLSNWRMPVQWQSRLRQTSADPAVLIQGSLNDCVKMKFRMRNRLKSRTLPALAALLIMAMPLYAESCASLAYGGGNGSSWKRCPKARECPPTPLVERGKFDSNTGWSSTANGLTSRNAHTTEAVGIAFQIPSAQTAITAALPSSQDHKLVCFSEAGQEPVREIVN
jgi:hypothetical protein